MSEHPVETSLDSPAADHAAATANAVKSARRRRLLKLGASGVPVALTVASRPVLAWSCNTTSAWGSAQMMPNASTTARNGKTKLPDETWTITNWKNNSSRSTLAVPWTQFLNYKNSSVAFKSQLLTALYGASGPFPNGTYSTDKIYDVICGSRGTFAQYMIVAKLNSVLITNVASCLKSNGVDQLSKMQGGNYAPPNGGSIWSSTMIQDYLAGNYIVMP
ncbi:hypothetical protein BH11PSE8_BH11PSE8_07310 [soil metagenome]